MKRPKFARFRTPLLKDWWTAYVSPQILVSLHVSFKSFSEIGQFENDLKDTCKLTHIWGLTYAVHQSLSRGVRNRAILGRFIARESNASHLVISCRETCRIMRVFSLFYKPILQIFYQIATPQTRESNASHLVISCVCWGKHILQIFYQIATPQTRESIAQSNASHLVISCVCWGKPILQIFYQIATPQTRSLNPRFLLHLFGQKTGFRARMNEIKSGIPCSASNTREQRIASCHIVRVLR